MTRYPVPIYMFVDHQMHWFGPDRLVQLKKHKGKNKQKQ